MISVLLLLLFFGVLAGFAQNGLWSNLVMLVNVILSILLAINYFEPATVWAVGTLGADYGYLLDFLMLWGIFGLSAGVMRALTDILSTVKVKFIQPVDQYGGVSVAACVAWLLVCFASLTLHTAPLAEHFLGFYSQPNASIFLGMLAPDRELLGFAHMESVGAMSRSIARREGGDKLSAAEPREFDAKDDFIKRYAARRAGYEKVMSVLGPGGN